MGLGREMVPTCAGVSACATLRAQIHSSHIHIMASRIIDSHQHVFWHGRDDAGLIADMDANGIAVSWLLSWEIHPIEHRTTTGYEKILNPFHVRPDGSLEGIPLQDLVAAKRRYPDRFILGFCPHPLLGDAPARLRAAAGIHGARVCGEWKFRIPFDDPRCLELYRTAGELGMPVVLHLDVPYMRNDEGAMEYMPSWYGGTVANLERALLACPETIFIGHAPGFWREISADAEDAPGMYPKGPVLAPGKLHNLLETHVNLYADLSAGSALIALERDADHAREFITRFSEKLLFARDFYGDKLAAFLAKLDLDETTRSRIYFENAERLVPPQT